MNFQITFSCFILLNPTIFFSLLRFTLFLQKLISSVSVFRKRFWLQMFSTCFLYFLRSLPSSFCFLLSFLDTDIILISFYFSSSLHSSFVFLPRREHEVVCRWMFNWIDRNDIDLVNVSIHVVMIIDLIFWERFILFLYCIDVCTHNVTTVYNVTSTETVFLLMGKI